MSKVKKVAAFLFVMCVACSAKYGIEASATENSEPVFKNGIYMGSINAAGKTVEEVTAEVEEYVEGLKDKTITLSVFDNKVDVSGEEFGISCTNLDVLTEALEYGTKGNIIERYKALKDLENQPIEYNIDLSVDEEKLRNVVVEKCEVFNQEAEDATLEKTSSGFNVKEGKDGIVVNEEETIKKLKEFITAEWKGENAEFEVSVQVEKPRGDAEQLAKVKDVLGTFSTSYSSSGSSRSANVANGTKLINGTLLYPGDSFSTYETISPFTEANGYYLAGSYLNGKVVESFGGGICQVSSTLYNAVLRAELQVDERHNHSMIVNYVDRSADAAIAGTAKDFKFTNNTDYPIYIEGYTANKNVYFNVYGCETRDTVNRKVSFESVTVSTTEPGAPQLVADGGQGVGYVKVTQSAHTGYVAELYKVVTENGTEVSRERVNKSTYQMSPQFVTVGTASADPNAVAAINSAIATGDLNTVKSVAAAYSGVADPNAAAALQQQLWQQQQQQLLQQQQQQQAAAAAAAAAEVAPDQVAPEAAQ